MATKGALRRPFGIRALLLYWPEFVQRAVRDSARRDRRAEHERHLRAAQMTAGHLQHGDASVIDQVALRAAALARIFD